MAMATRWKGATNVTETDMLSSPVGSAMAMATLGVLHVQGQAATNASFARVAVMMNVVIAMVTVRKDVLLVMVRGLFKIGMTRTRQHVRIVMVKDM
jgi:hypothetical protein